MLSFQFFIRTTLLSCDFSSYFGLSNLSLRFSFFLVLHLFCLPYSPSSPLNPTILSFQKHFNIFGILLSFHLLSFSTFQFFSVLSCGGFTTLFFFLFVLMSFSKCVATKLAGGDGRLFEDTRGQGS